MIHMLFAFPFIPFDASSAAPATDLWSRISAVYKQTMQDASQELWISSARIIQEHTARALLEASQACLKALAENASAVQQRAFSQLIRDNQKAAQMLTAQVGSNVFQAFQTRR